MTNFKTIGDVINAHRKVRKKKCSQCGERKKENRFPPNAKICFWCRERNKQKKERGV